MSMDSLADNIFRTEGISVAALYGSFGGCPGEGVMN